MNATRAVRLLAYWKIYRSNEKRAVRIAIVEAVDADSAIKIAIERFKITDTEQQKVLVARRMGRTFQCPSSPAAPRALTRPARRLYLRARRTITMIAAVTRSATGQTLWRTPCRLSSLPPDRPVSSPPQRSLFQTDSIALRMIMPLNWVQRRAGTVAWVQNVAW
jgi:hypothetical protein